MFRALDPRQVNALSAQLIDALEGQGGSIESLLAQTATFTSTLANRDELIGQVINNLTTVIGTVMLNADRYRQASTHCHS